MAGKLLAHLRGQWIGVLALLLVLTGGTAYALDGSNTVFTDDIVNGDVKVADIGQGAVATEEIGKDQVRSVDVRDDSLAGGGLTGADIADQSGVDTCVLTTRIGQLCARGENFARIWSEAAAHCANLNLRLPTLGEALELTRTRDIPNVDPDEMFWTSDRYHFELTFDRLFLVDTVNGNGQHGNVTWREQRETVCVTTPTN